MSTGSTKLDVLPAFAVDDAMNDKVRNTEHLRKVDETQALLLSQRAHFSNLAFGQLGVGALRAAMVSLLLIHVLQVVCLGAKEEMGRIHATTNVTTMEDVQVIKNRPMVDTPREAMGEFGASVGCERSISFWIQPAQPKPATICLLHLLPKSALRITTAGVATEFDGPSRAIGIKRFAATLTCPRTPSHTEPPVFGVSWGRTFARRGPNLSSVYSTVSNHASKVST